MSAFESHCQHLADNSPEKFVLSGNYWSTKRYFHYVIGEKDQGAFFQLAIGLQKNSNLTSLSLRRNMMTPVDLSCLVEALTSKRSLQPDGTFSNRDRIDTKHSNLTELDLSSNPFQFSGAPQVVRLLTTEAESSPRLKVLSLVNCNLYSDGVSDILRALADNTNLLSLNLSMNSAAGPQERYFARHLKKATCLTDLQIGNNFLSDRTITEMIAALGQTSSLRSLGLPGEILNEESCGALGDLVAVKGLTSLDISSATLHGVPAFSLGVAKSSSLSSLNIAHCGFVDSPVGDAKTVSIPLQLIHAIGIAPLKQLVLRCCHLSHHSMSLLVERVLGTTSPGLRLDALCPEPPCHPRVTLLDLSNCQLDFRNISQLMHGLSGTTSLRLLNLAGNHIHSDGAQKIAVFLKSNKSLQNLCLPHNDIEDSGGCEIFYALAKRNRTLVTLDLSTNRLSSVGLALSEMLRTNPVVQTLSLDWNPLLPATISACINALIYYNAWVTKLSMRTGGHGVEFSSLTSRVLTSALRANLLISELGWCTFPESLLKCPPRQPLVTLSRTTPRVIEYLSDYGTLPAELWMEVVKQLSNAHALRIEQRGTYRLHHFVFLLEGIKTTLLNRRPAVRSECTEESLLHAQCNFLSSIYRSSKQFWYGIEPPP